MRKNVRVNLAYKYFLGLAIDAEVPDDTTISYFRATRLGEEKFRKVFEGIVKQCIDKGLVKGRRQITDSTHITADMAVMSLAELIKLCRRNVLKTAVPSVQHSINSIDHPAVLCLHRLPEQF